MSNHTSPIHPADHPVFANLPNTQARLRATIPAVVYGGKFTVTHPDGSVSKRSSKSMTYTHAIVRVTTFAEVRRGLARLVERNIDLARQYEATHPEYATRYRSYAEGYQAQLDSTPTEGCEYVVISWSQSHASAMKRAKIEGERVVAVD